MRPLIPLLLLLLGWTAVSAVPLRAQDAPDPHGRTSLPPGEASMDVADLWHKIRHKDGVTQPDAVVPPPPDTRRFVVFAPTIGSRPSTGLTLGLNGNMAFFSGDPGQTHLSSVSGGVRVSQKQQLLSNVRYAVFTKDDRWFLSGDNRLNWTSLNAYALGVTPDTAGAINAKYTQLRVYQTAYRTIKPGLFVGGGVNVDRRTNIREGGAGTPFDGSAFASYSTAHGFGLDEQTAAGSNIGVIFDTRDNAINASRGWLASGVFRTFFNGFLGGDSTWQELIGDVRTYYKLNASGSQRIALWGYTDLVTGGSAPFFDLPTTGSDLRNGRGYVEGRNRGEHLAYGEIEYRGALTPNGLVGFVAFVNTTTIGSAESGATLFDNYAPAAGGGARLLLNKRSRTNLCADYAWGRDGSRGFYLSLQEAF